MTRTEQQAADLAQQIDNARNGKFLGGGIIAYERKAHGKKLPVTLREKPSGNPLSKTSSDIARVAILKALRGGGMTVRELSDKTGMKVGTTHERVLRLRDIGKVKHIGDAKCVGRRKPAKMWGLVS